MRALSILALACLMTISCAAPPSQAQRSEGPPIATASATVPPPAMSIPPASPAPTAQPVVVARAENGGYTAGLAQWRAADGAFAGWSHAGTVRAADGAIALDARRARMESDAPGAYFGRSYYNGGRFIVGETVSPATPAGFAFSEAIASWNVDAPAGTWTETLMRVEIGGRWTDWYSFGVWASSPSPVARHSAMPQRDADARVASDTLVLDTTATAFQLQVRLFAASADAQPPTVRSVAVALSTRPARPAAVSAPRAPARVLDVPRCSQMVYPDGGEVWCSPTSTAMVVGFWRGITGACEPAVREAVGAVYDWRYGGHGNWPFNTAYAATRGLEGYVMRLVSFAQAEEWIAAGVPLVLSYGWRRGELAGAPIPESGGHLAVLVGFDANGDAVLNDPAAPNDASVRRTYRRAELEALWLQRSGGTVYAIYPPGHATPPFR